MQVDVNYSVKRVYCILSIRCYYRGKNKLSVKNLIPAAWINVPQKFEFLNKNYGTTNMCIELHKTITKIILIDHQSIVS
jgi:hypothetical protein